MVSYTPKILPDLPVGRVPPSPAGLGQQAVAMLAKKGGNEGYYGFQPPQVHLEG